MRKKQNQSGFTAVEAVIILVVLAAIGFAGWYVWKHHKTNNTSTTSSSSSNASTVATNQWVFSSKNTGYDQKTGDFVYNFSDVSNWSLGTPKNGQNLEINIGDIAQHDGGTAFSFNDDMPNLSLNKLIVDGSYDNILKIAGDQLTLTNGINNTVVTSASNVATLLEFDNAVRFNGNQNVSAAKNGFMFTSNVTIGSSTVDFTVANSVDSGGAGLFLNGHVIGDGTLRFDKGMNLVGDVDGAYGNPQFTGKVEIMNGANVGIWDEDALGSGAITVDNGGSLSFEGSSLTFSNPLTLSGDGASTELVGGGNNSGTTFGALSGPYATITLSGQVTLAGDSQLGAGPECTNDAGTCLKPTSTTTTYKFLKPIKGSYSLTAVPSSLVKIVRQ